MAKCGNCGKADATVAEIRACYGGGGTVVLYGPNESLGYAVGSNPAKPEPVTITEGFWSLDGSFYKVQESQTTGHRYGKILDAATGGWTYVPGVVRKLSEGGATPLTEDEAAEFGKLYGVCMLCGRTLTNEESIERGIGPICAGKQGW